MDTEEQWDKIQKSLILTPVPYHSSKKNAAAGGCGKQKNHLMA
jgi:hypothetical protein